LNLENDEATIAWELYDRNSMGKYGKQVYKWRFVARRRMELNGGFTGKPGWKVGVTWASRKGEFTICSRECDDIISDILSWNGDLLWKPANMNQYLVMEQNFIGVSWLCNGYLMGIGWKLTGCNGNYEI
jgi:hypothetical protein